MPDASEITGMFRDTSALTRAGRLQLRRGVVLARGNEGKLLGMIHAEEAAIRFVDDVGRLAARPSWDWLPPCRRNRPAPNSPPEQQQREAPCVKIVRIDRSLWSRLRNAVIRLDRPY